MKTRIAVLLFLGITACGHAMDGGMTGTGKSSHEGWLGVSVQEMNPRLARSMRVETDRGVLVRDVEDASPADSAGIRKDDIIVEFDGKKTNDTDDLIDAVRASEPGTPVKLTVVRDDEKTTVDVRIGRLPRSRRSYSYAFTLPRMPGMAVFHRSALAGLELMELNDQLAEYFEVPGNEGVLVREVEKGSAADKAGFKAGDVIIQADKERVDDVARLRDFMEDRADGEKVPVEVIRKGSKKTLTLEVEDAPRHRRFPFGGSHPF